MSNVPASHRLLSEVQVVVEPLPGIDLLHAQAWRTVGERRKVNETPDQHCNNDTRSSPSSEQALANNALADRLRARRFGDGLSAVVRVELSNLGWLDVENEFDESTCDERRCEMGGKVVVQEELTTHDVEGDVVGGPGEKEEAGAIVEAGASTWEILAGRTREEPCNNAYACQEHQRRGACSLGLRG